MSHAQTRKSQIHHMIQIASEDPVAGGEYFLTNLVEPDCADGPDQLRSSFAKAIRDISAPYVCDLERNPVTTVDILASIPLDNVRSAIEMAARGIVLDPQ